MHHGSCLCGSVSFTVTGDLPPPDACHCTQCRKHSGHYFVSTDVPRTQLRITDKGTLQWFASSAKVRRGFCGTCGSSLFFDPIDQIKNPWVAVALGSFDDATHTAIAKHIFVGEKGDYYDLNDGLPQSER